MRIKSLLVGALCVFYSTVTHAAVYRMEFRAANFMNGYGAQQNPAIPIEGSIVFSAPSFGAEVTSIEAIDLEVGNHVYTVGEIASYKSPSGFSFGAVLNGENRILVYTDDFYLFVSSIRPNLMGFSRADLYPIWHTYDVAITVTELSSEVSEPVSIALFLAGASGLGLARRRRLACRPIDSSTETRKVGSRKGKRNAIPSYAQFH